MEGTEPRPSWDEETSSEERAPAVKGGWLRAILIFAAFILVQTIFGMLALGITVAFLDLPFKSVQTALNSGNWPELILLTQGIGLIGTLLLVAVFRWKIDRKDLRSLGLSLRPSHFLLGVLLGPTMMGICSLILYHMGHMGFRWTGIDPYYISIYLVLTFFIAVNEELLVRGYMLNNMMRSMKAWKALLITAAVFTLLHALNPSITWISILNLFLAGILLGITYIHDQELAFPIGLHLGWNLAQGPIFGFEVSGMALTKGSVFESWTVEGSPSYLTGGEFGLEGSLLLSALQIILIPSFYLIWKKMQ